MDIKKVLNAYITAALWSSVDDNGVPLDANYTKEDIQLSTLDVMLSDCEKFLKLSESILEKCDLTDEQIGMDFWLTRNGHGAGFWDRGLGVTGEKLTRICQEFTIFDLYVGENGKLY